MGPTEDHISKIFLSILIFRGSFPSSELIHDNKTTITVVVEFSRTLL